MQLITIQPVQISPGVSATGVSISAIIPHSSGVTVFFDQGFSVILADKSTEEGYGDYTINKLVDNFLISDIIAAIPLAIQNRFAGNVE